MRHAIAKKLLGYLGTAALGDLITELNDDSVNFLYAKLLARLVELRDKGER